ncbi:Photosynthetic reaction centre, L/M, partial [Cynara cardunculus var. scolymus]
MVFTDLVSHTLQVNIIARSCRGDIFNSDLALNVTSVFLVADISSALADFSIDFELEASCCVLFLRVRLLVSENVRNRSPRRNELREGRNCCEESAQYIIPGIFGGSLFSAMHGFLVTSSLIRETTKNESANEGYRFGQEEESYNIVAAYGYFGRLIFQYASFNNSRSLHFFLAAWHVV